MTNIVKFSIQIASFMLVTTIAIAGALAETVYTETNSASDNAIQIFQASDGSLTLKGSVSAGGKGTGAGLGNQGALALSEDGQWLFAVDAGSNEISTFAISGIGLALVAHTSSGGTLPISVTTHGNRLYVLNAGGSGNVNGFTVQSDGHLKAIPGSTRLLNTSGSGPAQIGVDKDGDTLVVTEKTTNQIAIYTIGDAGELAGPVTNKSNGAEPFGFAFDRGTLLVSEAFGGSPNASALSSYEIDHDDGGPSLEVISGSVPTHQTAACWTVVARHGRYAYVANTGSGTLTGYRVSRSGELKGLSASGATGISGGNPTDVATNRRGDTLIVLSYSHRQDRLV